MEIVILTKKQWQALYLKAFDLFNPNEPKSKISRKAERLIKLMNRLEKGS
jgi:hypothetical protein